MDTIQLSHRFIYWTRSITLILSLVVILLSLSEYNYKSLPISELLQEKNLVLFEGKQLLNDIVRDRRLIATLVAAQASIFCTLFLIMTNKTSVKKTSIWRTVFEKFCYFLTPLNLALSWVFSIIFDRKTELALLKYQVETTVNTSMLWSLVIYLENALKHVIIGVLMIEIIVIWISCFVYARSVTQSQAIQLGEYDEENCLVLCDEEEEGEKVLYI